MIKPIDLKTNRLLEIMIPEENVIDIFYDNVNNCLYSFHDRGYVYKWGDYGYSEFYQSQRGIGSISYAKRKNYLYFGSACEEFFGICLNEARIVEHVDGEEEVCHTIQHFEIKDRDYIVAYLPNKLTIKLWSILDKQVITSVKMPEFATGIV